MAFALLGNRRFCISKCLFRFEGNYVQPRNWVKGGGGNFAHETQSNGCPPSQSLLGPQEWQGDQNSKWDLNSVA